MAWPLESLSCKHEYLSSRHRTHIRKHVNARAHDCNPSDEETETGVS